MELKQVWIWCYGTCIMRVWCSSQVIGPSGFQLNTMYNIILTFKSSVKYPCFSEAYSEGITITYMGNFPSDVHEISLLPCHPPMHVCHEIILTSWFCEDILTSYDTQFDLSDTNYITTKIMHFVSTWLGLEALFIINLHNYIPWLITCKLVVSQLSRNRYIV